MATDYVAVDSLIANEFALEINGERVHGVLAVSGLVTYKMGDDGRRVLPPFEIAKMVQRDANNVFNTWLRETMNARHNDGNPRRDVTVVAIDDGVVTRRWTAKNAWIQEVRYSDFDSASFEMVAETFTIAYDDIEEEWPASS